MGKVAFAWPMIGDDATLSGGSWETTLPLTNLQTDDLSAVARSTDDANASTIIIVDHGAAKYVGVVALSRHNLRSAATWRIRHGPNASGTSPVYDSGTIACWPEQWPTGVLPVGHPNAATRLLTDAQIDALNPPRDVVHVFAQASARYTRIEIFDSANADGYVQIGRLTCAPLYSPTYNFAVGSESGFDDGTVVGRTLDRVKFFDVKPRARTLALQFVNLPEAEALTVVADMQAELGVSGQVYVIPDQSDTYYMQRRAFLATLRQLSNVQLAAAGYASVPLVLDEVL